MRRRGYFLMAGALALILTACGLNQNVNETKQDVKAEGKPDLVTEENLEYYSCRSGSASLCERFLIHAYKGEFIFIADYFDCGNELLETRLLSEEELKLFLEEINASFSGEEKKEKDTDKGNENRDGAYSEEAVLVVEGITYAGWQIDFVTLGIGVTNASDAEYPSNEENGKYELEGILELQESAQWKERVVFTGPGEFERSVGEQIEKQMGEEIDRMVIGEFLDEDFIIMAESKKGNSYKAIITYSGYVAGVEKE